MDQLAPITTEVDLHRQIQATVSPAIWGYVRVSTDKQEDGQSPEAQCDEIRKYAAALFPDQQLILVQEAASAALPMFSVRLPGMQASGPATALEAPRPLLGLLLVGLCDRPKSHLVIWKLDRLARVASEQEMFLSLFRRHEVTLHTAYEGERQLVEGITSAEQDPVRHLMRQILACFAEYERRLIHLRMNMGIRKKASKGGWVGGAVPFGYTSVNGDLKIDKDQASLVVEIFYLREVYNYTYTRISAALIERLGQPDWYKMRIMRVLNNRRLYCGIYRDPFGQQHERPDLKILPANWRTPIVAPHQEAPTYDRS